MTMTSMHSKQSSGSEMEPQIKKRRPRAKESFEEPPLFEEICTYITYGVLAVVGYVSDFLRFIGVKEGPRLKNVSCTFIFLQFFKVLCMNIIMI